VRQALVQQEKPKPIMKRPVQKKPIASVNAKATVLSFEETVTTPATLTPTEQEILAAWQVVKAGEKHNLEFGRLCYEWCQQYKAQGSHRGRGFETLCSKLGIVRRTAYRWILRFEIDAGLKEPKDEPRTKDEIEDDEEIAAELAEKRKEEQEKKNPEEQKAAQHPEPKPPDDDQTDTAPQAETGNQQGKAPDPQTKTSNEPGKDKPETYFPTHDADWLRKLPEYSCDIHSSFASGNVVMTAIWQTWANKDKKRIDTKADTREFRTTYATGLNTIRENTPDAGLYVREAAKIFEQELRRLRLWNVDTKKAMSEFIEDRDDIDDANAKKQNRNTA
jgi:hypothetical protein